MQKESSAFPKARIPKKAGSSMLSAFFMMLILFPGRLPGFSSTFFPEQEVSNEKQQAAHHTGEIEG